MGYIFRIHYYPTHFLIVFPFNVPGFPCVLNLHFRDTNFYVYYKLLFIHFSNLILLDFHLGQISVIKDSDLDFHVY